MNVLGRITTLKRLVVIHRLAFPCSFALLFVRQFLNLVLLGNVSGILTLFRRFLGGGEFISLGWLDNL